MTSEQKAEANRRNAKKSTGPRSEGGKARSRMNAVRHGLTAAQIILPGEDPAAFEHLRDGLVAEYQPQGPRETYLVDRLAALAWRSMRVPGFEASLLEWAQRLQAEVHDRPNVTANEALRLAPETSVCANGPAGSLDLVVPASPRLQTGRMLEALLREGDPLLKLARYDAYLAKQIRACVLELEEIREARTLTDHLEVVARPATPGGPTPEKGRSSVR